MNHIKIKGAYSDYADEIKILFGTTKTAIQYFPGTRDLSVCNVCCATIRELMEEYENCEDKNLQWTKNKC